MAPAIHCVRHAQGFHNLSVANHAMPDPLLTPMGKEQCRQLQEDFPDADKLDLIVASPIRRTLYTALLSFEQVIARNGLKVIALPELQETSDLPCDTGSSPDALAKEFDQLPVDLSLVKPGWNSKRMQWAPYAKAVEARSRTARQWLMARPEKNIAVVTHGGLLHYLTEDWTDSDRFEGTGWANTEFRSYTFSDQDPEAAHMVETTDSRRRRAGDIRPLSKEEQANLHETATKAWAKKGYVQQQQQAQETARHVQRVKAKLTTQRRDDLIDSY